MTNPRILLTNDDSHDSPLFLHAIQVLNDKGDLTVVVPAEEQSWKGKSMTRYGALYVDTIDLHGTPAYSVTGTPADCASLGIYNLMDEPPDLVVSGINIGVNTGLGFVLASGTVGACLEANIAGIPGLALSQLLPPEVFREWHENRAFQAGTVRYLDELTDRFVNLVWSALIEPGDPRAITWNVNFPYDVADEPQLRRTHLGETYYRRVFNKKGDRYVHELERFAIDEDPGSDFAALRSGHISVTEIDIGKLC